MLTIIRELSSDIISIEQMRERETEAQSKGGAHPGFQKERQREDPNTTQLISNQPVF